MGCTPNIDDYGEFFGSPGVAYAADDTIAGQVLSVGSGDFSDSTASLNDLAGYAVPSTVALKTGAAHGLVTVVITSHTGDTVGYYIGHSPSDTVLIGSGGDGTYTLDIAQSGIGPFLPGETVHVYAQGNGGSYSIHWVASITTVSYIRSHPIFGAKNDLRVTGSPPAGWEQPGFDDSGWARPVGVPRHPVTSGQQVWATELPATNTEALSARLTCVLDPAAATGHPVGGLGPYEADVTVYADRTLTALYLNGTAVTISAPTNLGEGVNGYSISADPSLIVAVPPYRNVLALTVQNAAYTPADNPAGLISPDVRGDRAGLSARLDIFALTCGGGYAWGQEVLG